MALETISRKGQAVSRTQLAANRAAGVKHCHACGETKPFTCFSLDKSRSDGLQPKCKDCYRAYRDANKERISRQQAGDAPTLAERYPNGVKQCEACEAVKDVSAFVRYAVPKDTLSPTCNDCRAEHRSQWEAADTARKVAWKEANPDWCRAYIAQWQRDNPDKMSAKAKRWRQAHREEILAKMKAARDADPETARERERARYAANAAHICRRKAKWRAAHVGTERARYKRYRDNNREKVRFYWKARSHRKRGASGTFTATDISTLMSLQNSKCAHPWCRVSLKAGHHIDHVMPLARGGTNDRRNLQLLCPPCNLKKHAKHPIDFAQENGLLL